MSYLSVLLKPNKFNALIWFQFILFVVLLLTGQINAINFVVIYFLESIIIGIFHFFFLLSLKNQPLDSDGNRVFISIFFLIHYMFFIFVQSIFLFNIIGPKIPEIDNSFNVLKNILIAIRLDGMFPLIGFVLLSQSFQYFKRWQNHDFYEQYKPSETMFQPYPRVFIQQFTVILSGFFIIFSNAIVVAALLITVLMTFLDLFWMSLRINSDKRITFEKYLNKNGTKNVDFKRFLDLFIN